ncbi:MAG: transcription-repair coupling factor [Gemmataceae bacterium]|nr:transcription-repair coupling factor [Gemmata sp.]MDW8198533.1 transcription-repair coupling factor [Gemmataceae bacterium]
MTTASVAAPADAGLRALTAEIRRAAGWKELREALAAQRSGTIDGAWGSSAALAAAALAAEAPGLLLVVVSSPAEVGPWVEDIATFSGTRPAVFEALDTWPAPASSGKLHPLVTARLRLLQQLLHEPPPIVVTCAAAVCQPVPARADLVAEGRVIKTGDIIAPEDLAQWLVTRGYKRVEAVEYPGEFSKRGGICDIFPPDHADPVRLEFFGDEVESLRSFAVGSQRSLETKSCVRLLPVQSQLAAALRAALTDYLPQSSWLVLCEPRELKEQVQQFHERVASTGDLFTPEETLAQLIQRPNVVISALPRVSVEAAVHLRVESVERFSGSVHRVRDELDAIAHAGTQRVLIACQTEAEVQRLTEVLKAGRLAQSHRLQLVLGHVRAGFRLVDGGVVVLGSHELFHKDLLPPGVKVATASSRTIEARAIDSFLDLRDGDYVVHVAHGIARFRGMTMLDKSSAEGHGSPTLAQEENLILEFRDGVLLYVPATRIDLVQKYVGGGQAEPELSKLGGTAWNRKKEKVAQAVRDMAAEMLQIQALRQAVPGYAFAPDSDWQKEFEAAFPFQETPDQLSAIAEVKADLEKAKPMDRLLCGDVGYGKTEIAIRAAFKVVDNGKQVAILVPTTILAEQHYRTFSQRFAEYPFVVDVINRFKSPAQQKETLQRLASGAIDVIVGTHRLLSDDVVFQDLGLVVIDEEQRFGVEHKEKLKRIRAVVDVLTMTATPIPRTLHTALLGIREISNLETPPPDRQPVETRIIRWDDQLIRRAILREMNRGGQVYFVHNRVQDIHEIADKVRILVPEARVVVGHGQMEAQALEKAMVDFIRKQADILVATTIIESGLDIPNANTIFIDDADIYGLADLHQLRGRVGRSKHRAYAYFIVNPLKLLNPAAQRRLKAIEEFTELGAGFKIALRDLEIRGAGNILGPEQSGHIAAVGYELYCQLLENAVRALQHLPPRVAVEVNVDLPWPAYLPRDYVPGQKLRIEVYRRLARLRDPAKLADFRSELRDRYGPPPEPVEWLLRTTEIRLLCVQWHISSIHRHHRDLIFTYRNVDRARQLTATSRRLKIVDDKSIYLRLQPNEPDDAESIYRLLVKVLKPA